jgi:hypothetical protein
MKPIDVSENNTTITPEQVETPVGCGGTCGGKCGGKKKCCGGGKCCCVMKIICKIVIAAALFYAGYLYAKTH